MVTSTPVFKNTSQTLAKMSYLCYYVHMNFQNTPYELFLLVLYGASNVHGHNEGLYIMYSLHRLETE